MRVAFIYRGAENLGIEYLSSHLKSHGVDVRLFMDPASFSGERGSNIPLLARFAPDWTGRISSAVARWEPDMAAFSVYTAGYQWALRTAEAVKKRVPAPVVFGGVHVTADPARVLKQDVVDAVVAGEGEGALLDLAQSLKNRSFSRTDIPNVGMRVNGRTVINPPRPYIRNLDEIPHPDKALFYDKSRAFSRAYLCMTSRGCPFRCYYCMNSLYPDIYPGERGHVRRRSVDNVIAELLPWRNVSKMATFWDDVFPLKQSWLEEFAEKYPARIGLPFLCYVHPKSLTERQAELLARAGCAGVKIGVQSVSESGRAFLGRTGGPEEARRAAGILKKEGIPFSMDHILGLPGEGEREFVEAARFYNDVRPSRVNTHWLSYFPGAKLLEEAARGKTLTGKEIENVREGIGQFTFMRPGAGGDETSKRAASAMMLMGLLPLAPKALIKRLTRKGLPKWLKYNRVIHQAMIVLASMKARDAEISGYLRYAFGRKNMP